MVWTCNRTEVDRRRVWKRMTTSPCRKFLVCKAGCLVSSIASFPGTRLVGWHPPLVLAARTRNHGNSASSSTFLRTRAASARHLVRHSIIRRLRRRNRSDPTASSGSVSTVQVRRILYFRHSKRDTPVTLAEWLRRTPAKCVGFSRVSSNLTGHERPGSAQGPW